MPATHTPPSRSNASRRGAVARSTVAVRNVRRSALRTAADLVSQELSRVARGETVRSGITRRSLPAQGERGNEGLEECGDYCGHQTARHQNEHGTDQESAEMKPIIFIACRAFCSWQHHKA